MLSTRWGDLPTISDTESGIAAIEREQMTKPRPLDIEGPELYQPCDVSVPVTNEQFTAALAIDPITRHTIQLIQHSRRLKAMIQDASLQCEAVKSGQLAMVNCPPPPSIPAYQGPERKSRSRATLPFVHKESDSLFARGIGVTPVEIDQETCHEALRRSVAAICAHTGYDTCPESVLETLTDVCAEYLVQMTQLLRVSVDSEAMNGSTGFPDAITRVFQEMGVGGTTVLHGFYQTRILLYHHKALHTCQLLQQEYETLRKPPLSSSDDGHSSMKEEHILSDIQFPSMDDMDECVDVEHMMQLEGLALDMNMSQESSTAIDEDTKWKEQIIKQEIVSPAEKPEPSDTASQSQASVDQVVTKIECSDVIRDNRHISPIASSKLGALFSDSPLKKKL